MKKIIKGLLIGGTICLIAGAVTAAVGFVSAYRSGLSFPLTIGPGFFSRHGGHTVDVEEHYGAPSLRKLSIDTGVAAVYLAEGDEYSVRAQGVPSGFQSEVDGDTWELSLSETWSVQLGKVTAPDIYLTVPAGCQLDEVELHVGAGELVIDRLATRELDIECGAGEVRYCGLVSGDIDVSCGVGSVQLDLENAETDFCGKVSCGIGSVRVGSHHYEGLGHDASFGGGGHEIEVDCGVGEVNVSFSGGTAPTETAAAQPGPTQATTAAEHHSETYSEEHHSETYSTEHHDETYPEEHHSEEHTSREHHEEGGEIHGF